MAFSAKHISIEDTGFFAPVIKDYVGAAGDLRGFYDHEVSISGVKAAIEKRAGFKFDRELLSKVLSAQYQKVEMHSEVQKNLSLLSQENTFTVCTAHQPNIFTGHLYFVYKILHAVRLADELSKSIDGKNFVPVFYMGSEDADLEELGSIEIDGKAYHWNTDQKGAVGRMKVDKALISLIDEISLQISVQPYGEEVVGMLRNAYRLNETVEDSTFRLINEMFGRFGLIVLLPDSKMLKDSFVPVLRKELEEEFSGKAVRSTLEKFPEKYKVQAAGRSINLFYLEEQLRERIEKHESGFIVNNSTLSFSKTEMLEELEKHPERFSPNVILRPVYQEWILPNVAFIGGGGELAYWLELKEVFNAVEIPMPVLVLRNSFMIVPKRFVQIAGKWDLEVEDLFMKKNDLINKTVSAHSSTQVDLTDERIRLSEIFKTISSVAGNADQTLAKHADAVHHTLMKKISGIEKKMMRAAKKKDVILVNQVTNLYDSLFPRGSLQERVENIIPFYSRWGSDFFNVLLQYSRGLEQDFTIICEK